MKSHNKSPATTEKKLSIHTALNQKKTNDTELQAQDYKKRVAAMVNAM